MSAVPHCVRRGVLACAVLTVAVATVGCGGKHHSSAHSSTSASAAAHVATRWWSNAAAAVGSTVDPAHPDAAAAQLHPSQAAYCGMLKQTVAAGTSILPSLTATDPALLTSTEAFLAEIERVAPPTISGQWQVIGPALLLLVKSGGNPSALPSLDLGALTKAANTIASDSLMNCGVNIASVIGLLPGGK